MMKKTLLGVAIGISILATLTAVFLLWPLAANQDESIGISQIDNFMVLEKAIGVYQAQFSLGNGNSSLASDAKIEFTVNTDGRVVISQNFEIKADDFETSTDPIDGKKFVIYSWEINDAVIVHSSVPALAHIIVTLPNEKTYSSDSDVARRGY
jgi:hypothetical protein